ncbi:MAG: hypothetical protein GY754_26410 [bacterium]|nr:hypothetical protein [bacterium]
MKKVLSVCIAGLLVISVFGFMGCEAGLTSNDGNGSVDDSGGSGFSFSDLYSRIKALEDENKKLNEEIEQLTNQQADTSSGLAGRIETLEGHVGSFLSNDLDSRINTLEGHVGSFLSNDLDSRINTLEGYVGGISVGDLKDTVDDLSYSASDGWSGTTLGTSSYSYQYISGAPEIILTDVKKGDVFLASLDMTAECGYSTLLATSGSIKWLDSSPVLNFGVRYSDFSHQNKMGIFKATSNGTIIIRMHMKGYKDTPCSGGLCIDWSGPISANQGSVLVSKLGIQ